MVTAILRPSDLPGHYSPSMTGLKNSPTCTWLATKAQYSSWLTLSVEYRYIQLKEDSGQPQLSADQLRYSALLLIHHDVQNAFGVPFVAYEDREGPTTDAGKQGHDARICPWKTRNGEAVPSPLRPPSRDPYAYFAFFLLDKAEPRDFAADIGVSHSASRGPSGLSFVWAQGSERLSRWGRHRRTQALASSSLASRRPSTGSLALERSRTLCNIRQHGGCRGKR